MHGLPSNDITKTDFQIDIEKLKKIPRINNISLENSFYRESVNYIFDLINRYNLSKHIPNRDKLQLLLIENQAISYFEDHQNDEKKKL